MPALPPTHRQIRDDAKFGIARTVWGARRVKQGVFHSARGLSRLSPEEICAQHNSTPAQELHGTRLDDASYAAARMAERFSRAYEGAFRSARAGGMNASKTRSAAQEAAAKAVGLS